MSSLRCSRTPRLEKEESFDSIELCRVWTSEKRKGVERETSETEKTWEEWKRKKEGERTKGERERREGEEHNETRKTTRRTKNEGRRLLPSTPRERVGSQAGLPREVLHLVIPLVSGGEGVVGSADGLAALRASSDLHSSSTLSDLKKKRMGKSKKSVGDFDGRERGEGEEE